MPTTQTDQTYIALLRNAASAVPDGATGARVLKNRKSALRDVLAEAGRHLSSVQFDVELGDEPSRLLSARRGDRAVELAFREDTEDVRLREGFGAIPIRWDGRAFQWVGRQADPTLANEPAWYTLAKTVIAELASPES